jgi:hypothetical protein
MEVEVNQDTSQFKATFSRLLRTTLESCRFSSREADYSADELRQRYYHAHALVENDVWVADLSDEITNNATALLKTELAVTGLEWSAVHLNHSLIPSALAIAVSGTDPLALIQCALRGAAILGPEKATDIIYGWLHGDRLGYVRNYAISRLRPDSRTTPPFELGYDACIRTYQPSEHSVQVRTFIQREHYAKGNRNPGQLHLVQLRCRGRRALHGKKEDTLYDDERLNLVKAEVLLSVLSIETNSFIGGRYKWTDYGDLGAFVPRLGRPVTISTEVEWPPEIRISPARLRRICRNWQGVFRDVDVESIPAWYYNVPAPIAIKKAFLATRRWRKAASGVNDGLPEDKLMELRVVLDLLLSSPKEMRKGATANVSRMAKRAERWIGSGGVDGRSTKQCVKRLYGISSRVLHTGTFRSDDEVTKELSIGRTITRKMLRKGLASGFKTW